MHHKYQKDFDYLEGFMKTLLFVDYSYYGFYRYAAPLIKEIRAIDPDINMIGVFMEPSEDKTDYGFDSFVCANKHKYNPVPILEEYSPDAIIVVAHRFFDYMFTLEAHHHNIPVFNFQHGLYMDSTTVSKLSKDSAIQLIKKKRDKIKIYLKCLYYINQKRVGKTLIMYKNLVQKHSLYEVMNNHFGSLCNADVSFIYGEYWKEYYINQYKEAYTQFTVVGYPELEGKLHNAGELFKRDLPTLCYLAQTSVEDGAISSSVLENFLAAIEEQLGRFNLVLKLHPRSDKELYKDIIKNNECVSVWSFPEFPKCDCYIGHESTVVARAIYITNKTLVYRLSEDRISPFEQYTNFVCTAADRFPETLEKMLSAVSDTLSPELKKYVYKNPNGAIKQTATIILDYLEKE